MKKIALVILLIVSSSFAEYSPGSAGYQFLKTNMGARASGIGGAFVAVANDVHTIYYNPAGIATFGQRMGSVTYLNDLLDFSSGYFGVVQPEIMGGNAGVSLFYKDYGDFKKTDSEGVEHGSFGANSFVLTGTYARGVITNLAVGVNAKIIRAAIESYSSMALALDVGAQYHIPHHQLIIGMSINNVGKEVSPFIDTETKLPFKFQAGFSKKLAHLPLLLNLNTYTYSDEDWQWILGGEFTLSPKLLLRLGYDSYGRKITVDETDKKFVGGALGLGILLEKFTIDYSFTHLGDLGSLNRFTISGHF